MRGPEIEEMFLERDSAAPLAPVWGWATGVAAEGGLPLSAVPRSRQARRDGRHDSCGSRLDRGPVLGFGRRPPAGGRLPNPSTGPRSRRDPQESCRPSRRACRERGTADKGRPPSAATPVAQPHTGARGAALSRSRNISSISGPRIHDASPVDGHISLTFSLYSGHCGIDRTMPSKTPCFSERARPMPPSTSA